ncbi:MAG: SHOCT domain-containing protein [Candidatus Dormibacteria bacterium]
MDRHHLPPPPQNIQYHGADGLWWLHGLFSLLIVLALIGAAVYLLRMFLKRPMPRWGSSARNAAIDALDLRYARGEIDRADYLQRQVDLLDRLPGPTSGPAQPPGPPTAA